MIKSKNLDWSILLIILSYLSFVIGFFINENSSGGGKIDFEHTLSTVNIFKLGILDAINHTEYESSRPPLFAILNSFNPYNYSDFSLRLSNFIFNCIIPLFFYLLIKKQNNFDKNIALSLTSLILLSPYFRTTSFWALEENLPFLFFFITLILLPLNNIKYQNIIIISIFSSLAVYSEQKFIFLSFFTYIYFLNHKKNFKDFFYISLIYFITAIPYIYLISQWGAITPPQPSYRFGLNLVNISYILSIVNFYFIPLFIFLILDNQLKDLVKDLKRREFIVIILIVLINFILLPDFKSLWGNGVISKISYYFINTLEVNVKLIQLLFMIYNCFGSFFIYLILSKNFKNLLPFIIIFIQACFIQVVHQEYIDPLFYLLIFCYFEYEKISIYKNKLIYMYLLFSIMFLIFANLYYGFLIQV